MRSDHTSVVFGGKIWVLGGDDGINSKNDVWSSSDGKTWEEKTDAEGWSVRSDHTSVVFDKKIWVLGGSNVSRKKDVWSSSDEKTWTQEKAAADWSGREMHTSVVFDKKIWVLGGDDGNIAKKDVWSSLDGKKWDKETDNAGWSKRYGHTSVVFDKKIWVLGGHDSKKDYKNDVWSSSDGKKWEEHPIPSDKIRWSGRASHTSVVFDKKIWVLGGKDGDDSKKDYKNDVWSSSDGKKWEEHPIPSSKIRWSKRWNHTSVVFGGKIWVLGGRSVTIREHDVWSSSDGKTWEKKDAADWSGRWGHTSVVFGGKIWVLGGYDGSRKNDVWAFEP